MKDVSNLINICPTNPIQVSNQHGIIWRFCLWPSNVIFDIDLEKKMLVIGPHGKDRNYSRDEKKNIGNPKANRGGPPLQANRT